MEKKETNGDGPTTWAQAALTSLNNKANVANAAVNSKGPLKPKLVARASGSETPPWKTNRKAPRISPSAVPDALRPLLSYTLWRLYENVITRTEKNQSIILTDNPDLYDTARKLDISVQRIGDFRLSVSAQEAGTDRNSVGDLEREFGMREPKVLPVQNGKIHVVPSEDDMLHRNGDHIIVQEKEDVDKIEVNGQHIDTEGGQDDNLGITWKDNDGKAIKLQVNGDTNEPDNESSIADLEERTTNEDVCESISSAPAEISVSAEKSELSNDELPKSTTAENQNPIVVTQPAFVFRENALMLTKEDIKIDNAVATQPRSTTDVDVRSATSNLVDTKGEETTITNSSTPVVLASSVQTHRTSPLQLPSQPQQSPMHRHSTKNSTSSSRRSSNVSSPAATQNSVEPEDSDEEVVVFNPKLKRMSGQKPSKQFSQRQPNHASNFQQVPQVKATIIDPDAFGRSFATNTRGYIPNGQRARNSPRGSPRRGLRMTEPEVDYVLKSGATREASRGQGKLWVP